MLRKEFIYHNWEVHRLSFVKLSLGLDTEDSSHEHKKATDSENNKKKEVHSRTCTHGGFPSTK